MKTKLMMVFVALMSLNIRAGSPSIEMGRYAWDAVTSYNKNSGGLDGGVETWIESQHWYHSSLLGSPHASRKEYWNATNPALLKSTIRFEYYDSTDVTKFLTSITLINFYPPINLFSTFSVDSFGFPKIKIEPKNEMSDVKGNDGETATFVRSADVSWYIVLLGGTPANSDWDVTLNVKAFIQPDVWNFWNDGDGIPILGNKIEVNNFPCEIDGNITVRLSNNGTTNPLVITVPGEHNFRFYINYVDIAPVVSEKG